LKQYKLTGIDQILAKLIQAELKHCILTFTDFFIQDEIRKNCHSSGRKLV
jgi:hypothetical protein